MTKKFDTPIYLQITFEDEETLEENLEVLARSEEFKNLLKAELYPRIEHAIEKNLQTLTAFRLYDQDTDLILDRSEFSNMLDTFCTLYEEEEDYTTCEYIQQLKKKI